MKKACCFLIFILLTPAFIFPQTNNTLNLKEKKKGWSLLFDGISTKGWTTTTGQAVKENGWVIVNGCLKTVIGDKGTDIITVNEYSDFKLSVDFNITPGCNSGVN